MSISKGTFRNSVMISCSYKIILLFICISVTETLSIFSKPVDCSVTPWSPWSSPNSSGQQTRLRRIMRHPRNGGKPCPILSEKKGSSDCVVSSWSSWSADFGFGQQTRVRNIIQQATGTGKQCPVLEEIRYTGKIPTVNVTAKNVLNFFARPNGKYFTKSKIDATQKQTRELPRDLVIIMDSSGSIGARDFKVAKEQTAKLIGLLCPNAPFDKISGAPYQYNQAAMLTYSTNVVVVAFNTYGTTVTIQNAINNAAYAGQSTNTNRAFDRARDLFQPSKGVRDAARAKREVLILTDGRSNSQTLTLAAVERLKKEADVYGLMIGGFSTSGMDELTQYVSSPINQHLFYIENFQKLKDLLNLIEAEKMNAGANWCAPFNP